jgi:hypothetical protein
MVTVQYANRWIDNMSMEDFRRTFRCVACGQQAIAPVQEGEQADPAIRTQYSLAIIGRAMCRSVKLPIFQQINTPTEVDHYQIRPVIDIYVATQTEALQAVGARVNKLAGLNAARPQHDVIRCAGRW